MKHWLMRFSLMMLLLIPVFSIQAQDMPAYKIVGYFAEWTVFNEQPYLVTDIPADKLTHINYAFVNISDEGECMVGDEAADTQLPYPGDTDDQELKGNFNQFIKLKEKYPHLKTLISVGGWSWSDHFSDVALTPESREKFASSCVDFILKYGFDGIDIDWEYPAGGGEEGNVERPEDADNFILLLQALRDALTAQGQQDGKSYLLTMAASTSLNGVDWSKVHPILDWMNVMTYDFSGSWSSVTGFNSPLYDSMRESPEGGSIDSTIQSYLAAGIPAEKLVVGVPFYGRGWTGVKAADTNALHQPYTGVPGEEGSYDYRVLVDKYIRKVGYERFWSDVSQVPWLYDAKSGTMISYDDPESIGLKTQYVRDNHLGGVMFWELSGDTTDYALTNAIYDTLMKP